MEMKQTNKFVILATQKKNFINNIGLTRRSFTIEFQKHIIDARVPSFVLANDGINGE